MSNRLIMLSGRIHQFDAIYQRLIKPTCSAPETAKGSVTATFR
jgi:hypothetical protein